MKRLVCLVLVLAFCFCLSCPVFASESNDDFLSSPGTEPDCEHDAGTTLVGKKDPTCTEDGYTGDLICSHCGEVLQPGEVIPRHGHHYVNGVCEICGEYEDNPQTGDTSFLSVWVGIMAVAAAGLVAVTAAYRKEFASR